MMGFWDLSDGGSAKETGTEYEVPGGNMDPIPDGSSVLAVIDEAKWERKATGEEYVSLRWSVMAPEQYKNRKVFHKLWLSDLDPSAKDEAKGIAKRDKAKRMFAAIDANAGGKLAAKGERPTDDSMTLHLCNKPMVITLMTWEVSDSRGTATGNWVSAVANKANKDIHIAEPKAKAAPRNDDFSSRPSGGGGGASAMDDEIPFAPCWQI